MATDIANDMATALTRAAAPLSVGPLLAARTEGRLDQAAMWHLVRRLARAAGIAE